MDLSISFGIPRLRTSTADMADFVYLAAREGKGFHLTVGLFTRPKWLSQLTSGIPLIGMEDSVRQIA